MKKADLDQVKLVVRDAVHEVMEPMNKNIDRLNQTVYGVTGNNGLCGDMKAMKAVAEDYKVYKGKLATIGAIGAGVFGVVGGFVSKLIKIGG